MSRQAPRRPEPAITSSTPVSLQDPPQPVAPAATGDAQPPIAGGWFIVQWLWLSCFVLLWVVEVGLFAYRKLTH